MSFAGALPILQSEWGLSNAQAGIIQSAGQVGYLLAVLVISSLTDYIDSRRLIVGGAIWAGISNLLLAGIAYDTASAAIIRALVGFGIAGIYMPGLKLITQRISGVQRGRAVGLFVGSFTLGSAISIALGGNLASILGWRVAFGLTSIGPLLGAMVSWRYLPNSTENNQSEQKSRPIRELLQNRQALIVMLIYVCHAWEVLGLRSWLATFLTAARMKSGFDLAEATSSGATIAGIATLLAAAATASVGAISDSFSRIKIIIMVMSAGFIFILFLGFSLPLPWMAIVIISLIAAFLSNADSAVISTRLTEVVPEDYLGRTLAIYSFLGFAAGSVSPLVFGATLDFANTFAAPSLGAPWSWAFATLAVGSLFGLVLALRLNRLSGPVRA
jgi:MFS family permease